MLILKRQQQRANQPEQATIRIECPDGAIVTVVLMEIGPGWGRIGIDAPPEYTIHRQEYFDRMQQRYAEFQQANSEAATEDLGSASGAYRESDRA